MPILDSTRFVLWICLIFPSIFINFKECLQGPFKNYFTGLFGKRVALMMTKCDMGKASLSQRLLPLIYKHIAPCSYRGNEQQPLWYIISKSFIYLRDRPFLIPGTRTERIWLGYEKYLTIFDGARKIFDTMSWGTK